MWNTLLTACLVILTGNVVHAQSGTLIVLNKNDNTANIIDVASGRILKTLPTGRGPHEAAISTDGLIVVGTNYGRADGTTLTVIDVDRMEVARTVDLGDHVGPHGIAFLPGDSLVAVTTERSREVVIVRVLDGEVVRVIRTEQAGSHMLAMIETGATIYTSNMGDNSVAELDVATARRLRTFAVPARPEALTVTRDGSEVWVGSNETGTVNVVNTRTGETERALDGLSWPYRILIAPDNALVLIPDLNQNVLRFVDRASRRELARLDFAGAGTQGITLNADATLAFLSLNREDRVAVIDLRSRQVIRHIGTGGGPDGIVFTPRVLTTARK